MFTWDARRDGDDPYALELADGVRERSRGATYCVLKGVVMVQGTLRAKESPLLGGQRLSHVGIAEDCLPGCEK